MPRRKLLTAVCLSLTLLALPARAIFKFCGIGSLEGTRDTLSVFSPFAVLDSKGATYKIPVVGWLREKEEDSLRRHALDALVKQLELSPDEAPIFRKRMTAFLADNERDEQLTMSLSPPPLVIPVGRTNKAGYVERVLELPAPSAAGVLSSEGGARRLRVRFAAGSAAGNVEIPVMAPTGLSIVSDIDDTIKVTEVLDRKEMLRNTFTRKLVAVPGMAPLYQRWAARGAAFHYVSASPWQLLEFLEPFLSEAGFPAGTFHLRSLRLRDFTSVHAFLSESRAEKTRRIQDLLGLFPGRRFILVGDSGELDPEIYGELARRYARQIEHIYLRVIPRADNSDARFAAALSSVPPALVTRFTDPASIDLPKAP